MGEIANAAKALESQLVSWYRELHRCPEIGHDLPKTEAFIVRELSKMGLDNIKSGLGSFRGMPGHGVTADLKGGKPGKTLAIRSDMDALPIKESTGLDHASENEYMHACGHDAHVATLLGAVKLISERRSELKGNIRFIFQPAEEYLQGAMAMVESGVIEGVDAIIGMHISSLLCPTLTKTGIIGWRNGPTMAASDEMDVVFKGKGAHGSTPHLSIDPIFMASEAVCQLQRIVSRETDPLDTVVISIGAIQGGNMCNIIPDTCTIKSTIRTLNSETRDFVLKRAKGLVEDVARSMRGTTEVDFPIGCGPVVNNPEMVSKMCRAVENELGKDMLIEMDRPLMGAEDFSVYLNKIPGAFFFHSARFNDERDMPHHNSKFQLNESAFWSGTAALTAFAFSWQD